MKYEVCFHSWYGCDEWYGEFNSHAEVLKYYKYVKNFLNTKRLKDSIYKVTFYVWKE